MKTKIILILSLFCLAFVLAQSFYAQALEEKADLSDNPITILSDTLRYFHNHDLALFEGKVEATNGDMQLSCDKMSVNFFKSSKIKEPKKSTQKIKKIYAQGNVIMTTPQEKASAKRGELDLEKGLLYLFDDVKLNQDDNIMTGNKLTYSINTKEALVSSDNKKDNSSRVKGIFIPKDKQSGNG